ncbi:hypothetical protein [Nocardioides sp. YIM 152588]|uniref:arsenate reductase/protein-tyrosine-phosphatase family protein n=1 Tax=Nocardioides sp. YIM 152588 TaxID=3158259 RepID=UPI0032E45F29
MVEPDTPLRVLFVCTANICRSPYLELRARQLAAGSGIEFASAGVRGHDHEPVSDTMAAELHARGAEPNAIRRFRSRPLTADLVGAADLVLTAEAAHRTRVLDEAPAAFRKVFTVGQFAQSVSRAPADLYGAAVLPSVGEHRATADPALDIADPYRHGPAAAAVAADAIDALLAEVLPRLTGKVTR